MQQGGTGNPQRFHDELTLLTVSFPEYRKRLRTRNSPVIGPDFLVLQCGLCGTTYSGQWDLVDVRCLKPPCGRFPCTRDRYCIISNSNTTYY